MRRSSSRTAAELALLATRIVPLPSALERSPFRRRSARDSGTSRESDGALLAASAATTVISEERNLSAQQLTLFLAGITAEDYLAWVHDSEPPALGHRLKSITTRAEPRGRRIDVELLWHQAPPPLRAAAIAAGFPLTPHVVALRPTGF